MLSERIKTLRKKKGMSQEELANELARVNQERTYANVGSRSMYSGSTLDSL